MIRMFPAKLAVTRSRCAAVGLAIAAVAQPVCVAVASSSDEQSLACRVGTAYVGYIEAHKPEPIRDLWAENVDYTGPDGVQRDRAAVIELYDRGVKNRDWTSKIVSTSPFGSNGCLVEIWSDTTNSGKFTPAVVDRFEVNAEGKITRFNAYVSINKATRYLANMKKNDASTPPK